MPFCPSLQAHWAGLICRFHFVRLEVAILNRVQLLLTNQETSFMNVYFSILSHNRTTNLICLCHYNLGFAYIYRYRDILIFIKQRLCFFEFYSNSIQFFFLLQNFVTYRPNWKIQARFFKNQYISYINISIYWIYFCTILQNSDGKF